MSDEAATVEVAPELAELGDKIAELSLKQAKELSDYLKDKYGIEPASGGAVMVAAGGGAGGGEEAAPEKTEFDVVLTGFGDKKLNVVKVVKNLTGKSLMDAKKLVESAPATIKEAAPKEEAEKLKAELEEAGASVELK
jgi:large subunit ribosomal protein L7/L12